MVMKIRTTEQLLEKIDTDFAWRRKELSVIFGNAKSTKEPLQSTALRVGIALLYAHWEGFIKYASEMYLEFVASQKLRYCDLNHSFIALAFRKELIECEETNKSTIHNKTVKFLLESMEERAQIPCQGVIKTKSNLNSEILKEITATIDLDFTPYELKCNLIDAELLKYRNEVAHGQYVNVNLSDFETLYNEVTGMLNLFKNQIQNAAITKSFLKVS